LNINWHWFTQKSWCIDASAAYQNDAWKQLLQFNSLYHIWYTTNYFKLNHRNI